MKKRHIDGHLMPFSIPFARAVLPQELAALKSDKLLARTRVKPKPRKVVVMKNDVVDNNKRAER